MESVLVRSDALHKFLLMQWPGILNLRIKRVKSTPDPGTLKSNRDTPPISIAILLQKYALFLTESSIYATNLYHDTAPICTAMLLQKY